MTSSSSRVHGFFKGAFLLASASVLPLASIAILREPEIVGTGLGAAFIVGTYVFGLVWLVFFVALRLLFFPQGIARAVVETLLFLSPFIAVLAYGDSVFAAAYATFHASLLSVTLLVFVFVGIYLLSPKSFAMKRSAGGAFGTLALLVFLIGYVSIATVPFLGQLADGRFGASLAWPVVAIAAHAAYGAWSTYRSLRMRADDPELKRMNDDFAPWGNAVVIILILSAGASIILPAFLR